MNNSEKKEAVRQAIVRAVPSVMELKFGCEVRAINLEEAKKMNLRTGYVISKDFCLMDEYDELKHCEVKTSFVYHNIGKLFEIIGRPITLADVIAALLKTSTREYQFMELIHYYWDLSQDFDHQSETVWKFLYGLLCE